MQAPKLKKELKEWLKNAERLVILGIGNKMLGDDGAGVLVAEKLFEAGFPRNLRVIKGGVAPENFTGQIVKFRPTHLLLVDAALFKGKPGTFRLFPAEKISGLTLSTHRLPLTLLIQYLEHALPRLKIKLLAIKPARVGWGLNPSPTIRSAAKEIARILLESLPHSLLNRKD